MSVKEQLMDFLDQIIPINIDDVVYIIFGIATITLGTTAFLKWLKTKK